MKNIRFSLVFCLLVVTDLCGQTVCTVTVTQGTTINSASRKLLGTSFDARSSLDFDPGPGVDPAGYYDPATGLLLPAVAPAWNRVPMGGVRYPGNAISFNWNWSYTIGPLANRTPQLLAPGLTQSLAFGFDEFMAMTASKGLASNDVQIMVNIYPSTGQPNPGTLAADWVEYCNTPNNGSNPRGGINWAALRAANGHPAPYAVRIWNLGNEPWQAGEFGLNGAAAYVAVAGPIIDSMLLVDPTIDLTLASVGNASSAWNSVILASALVPKIYGLSPHAFYDEDVATSNPTVIQVQNLMVNLASAAASLGLKIVHGDQAYFAPPGDPDKAMRWEGALTTADYLLMISQVANVELSNFWIYGNVKATWHPIRGNTDGTYTLMAVGQLYEAFFSRFHEKSLLTSVTNPSGGAVPKVRAAAFKKNDASKMSVLMVNTDQAIAHEVVVPVLSGFTLQSVKKITAASINEDTSQTTIETPLGNGHYSLPAISVLIFEYQATVLAVEFIEPFRATDMGDLIEIEWTTATELNNHYFDIEHSQDGLDFQSIKRVAGQGNSSTRYSYRATDENPFSGLNYYRIKQTDFDGAFNYSNVISVNRNDLELTVWPNPVSDRLQFRCSNEIDQILLKNSTGVLMRSIETPAGEVELSELPAGVYFVEFLVGDYRSFPRKIIRL